MHVLCPVSSLGVNYALHYICIIIMLCHMKLSSLLYTQSKVRRYIQTQASITGEHSIPLSGTSPPGIAVGTVSVERVTVI